jgi:hypothetical protein
MTYGLPDSIVVGAAKRASSYVNKKEKGYSGRIDRHAEMLEQDFEKFERVLERVSTNWGGLTGWKRLFGKL